MWTGGLGQVRLSDRNAAGGGSPVCLFLAWSSATAGVPAQQLLACLFSNSDGGIHICRRTSKSPGRLPFGCVTQADRNKADADMEIDVIITRLATVLATLKDYPTIRYATGKPAEEGEAPVMLLCCTACSGSCVVMTARQ